MNPLLADPAAAPTSEQPAVSDQAETAKLSASQAMSASGQQPPTMPDAPSGAEPPTPPAGRSCANCEMPLQDGQEWCLQCGAGQPGSLGERPNWRPLTTLALAAALLTGAAAAAGAAALSSHKATPPPTLTVAQTPAPGTPGASTPGTSTPGATTPVTPVTPGTATTPTVPPVKAPQGGSGANGLLFPSTGKPPKIPSSTSTPGSSQTNAGNSTGSGKSTSGSETGSSKSSPTTESKSNGGQTKAESPSALLLDTNAASTYNPYNYPEAGFGDAALAIDGEIATAWTAQVQPSSAPRMAVGLLLNLKTATRLGSVTLRTLSPGMTVQLYGANGHRAPATITEPGWSQLSASHVLKKKTTKLKLRTEGKAFHFLVVWIIQAPAAAVGTPQAPGQVSLNEVELFPPAS